MSISSVCALAEFAIPSPPKTAASMTFAEFRLVMTKEAARAASDGEAATRAPLSASGCSLAASGSKTATLAPVSRSLAAIAPPMTPTPTTATFGEEKSFMSVSFATVPERRVTS